MACSSVWPSCCSFSLVSIPQRPAFEGPLQPNDVLSKGKRLFTGQLVAPESFATDSEGECPLLCGRICHRLTLHAVTTQLSSVGLGKLSFNHLSALAW